MPLHIVSFEQTVGKTLLHVWTWAELSVNICEFLIWHPCLPWTGQCCSTALVAGKLQQHQPVQIRISVAWWGRGTQAGFRGWIIHSHENSLLVVSLIFNSTCMSENLSPSTHQVTFPWGKPHLPAVLSLNCENSSAVAGMLCWDDMYWRRIVQCTVGCCVTGLRHTEKSEHN